MPRTRKSKLFVVAALLAISATASRAYGSPQSSTATSCTVRPDILAMKLEPPVAGQPIRFRVAFYARTSTAGESVKMKTYLNDKAVGFSMHIVEYSDGTTYYNTEVSIPSYEYVSGDTYAVTFTLTNDCGTSNQTESWAPSSAKTTPVKLRYVALGDSYSSGEGNPPFTGGKCHRSTTAWPVLAFSHSDKVKLVANLACSGAHTDALFNSFHGQTPQLKQLKTLHPDIVTITIGGNDVGFGSSLGECSAFDCEWLGMLRGGEAKITKLRERLTYVFGQIKQAAPGAKIYVIGYPRIFPTAQSQTYKCGWLEPQEREDINSYTAELNAEEKLAAQTVGVQFVSVFNALKGHEMCTRNSWMFKLSPACLKFDSRCGHPLGPGQEAIASIVRKRIG